MAEKEKDKEKSKVKPPQPKAAGKPQQKSVAKGSAPEKKEHVKAIIEKAAVTPRLKELYFKQVMPLMMGERGYENAFQVPRLKKIVLNMGVSEAKENIQALDAAREDMAAIAGQQPQIRRAKKSISNFKLREGMPIGVRVTLRGDRMYEFLDRLIATAVPRIRDFRGLEPRGFDGRGNFNLGLREQMIFNEINIETAVKARGMNITFVTNARTDEEGFDLLVKLGMPFKQPSTQAKPAAGEKKG
jgi:large subunit ribosomal protein L5